MSWSPRERNSTGSFRALSFRLLRCTEQSHELSLFNGFHTEQGLCPKRLWFWQDEPLTFFYVIMLVVLFAFDIFRPNFESHSPRARTSISRVLWDKDKLIKERSRSLLVVVVVVFLFLVLSYILFTTTFSLLTFRVKSLGRDFRCLFF